VEIAVSSPQPPYNPNPYGSPGYGQQPPPPGYGPPPGYAAAPPPPGYAQPYPPQQPPPGYGAPNPYAQQYAASFQKPTGWFVVNWLFFWPLAIYSLTSAWGNIDRALFAGDLNGAKFHADRVKKFGIISLCIGLGWIVLVIILVAAAGSSAGYCSGYSC
jgi:hypothetical protein